MVTARKKRLITRERFSRAQRTEVTFGRGLSQLVKQLKELMKKHTVNGVLDTDRFSRAAKQYSKILTPWAEELVNKMHGEVLKRNELAWSQLSKEIGLNKRKFQGAPVKGTLRDLLNEQVHLIKSIPIEAAQRVHDLSSKGLLEGGRTKAIEEDILRQVEVSRGKARVIARTEVARTASLLTETRAKHIGSEGYIWRTSRDSDVRDSHKKMEGKFVRYDSPPTLDGLVGHAGQLPN